MDRETILLATLRDWRRSAFVWGDSDCIASVMTYAGELCGTDPGARYRLTYSDRAGAHAIVDQAGGVLPLMDALLTPCGFDRIDQPTRGDIIVADLAGHEIAGLWLGAFAVFRLDGRGVIELRADKVKVLAAWR